MTRSLVLCADDFGFARGISRAIVVLLGHGRLSATSCMSVSPLWPEHAAWLRAFADTADVGLHLTLTDVEPLGQMPSVTGGGKLPPLSELARRVMASRLNLTMIRAELDRQFDAFIRHWGRTPDFVDGHQHVHLLAGIRDIVIDLVQKRAPQAYVRQCWDSPAWIMRRGVAVPRALGIAVLSLGLRRRLGELRCNDSFRGVSDFRYGADYRSDFQRYLIGPGLRPLIMCHPGYVDDRLRRLDPVTDQRESEFRYFASQDFTEDLAAAGYRLARMGQRRAAFESGDGAR